MTEAADIEAQAASWIARCDARGSCEDAELASWLLADPRHRAAYLRLAEAWSRTERLARLRPMSGSVDADLLAPARPSARRMARPAAARISLRAAAALAAAGAFLAWWGLSPHAGTRVYRTGPAGLSRVALPDGTVATLNAHTELRVHFLPALRAVTLVEGEAQFHVVHDSRRPFQVAVDGRVVRDVGTIFDVRRDDARTVEVLVTSGRVAVLPVGGEPSARRLPLRTLGAHQLAVLTAHRVTVRRASPQEMAQRLLWERRKLYFQGETLQQAVAEFNRYNYRRLVIDESSLARLRIGGNFRALDVHSFVAALARSFNIEARPGPHHSIELYRSAGL